MKKQNIQYHDKNPISLKQHHLTRAHLKKFACAGRSTRAAASAHRTGTKKVKTEAERESNHANHHTTTPTKNAHSSVRYGSVSAAASSLLVTPSSPLIRRLVPFVLFGEVDAHAGRPRHASGALKHPPAQTSGVRPVLSLPFAFGGTRVI